MKMAMQWSIALALLTLPAVTLVTSGGDACMANADASLAAMVNGDFTAATKDFSPMTAKQLPAEKLKQTWAVLQAQAGKYLPHGSSHRQKFQGESVVVTRVTFATAPLVFVISCDHSHRIEAFKFLKPQVISRPPPIEARADDDSVRVAPVAVPSPLGALRGALTLPAGQGPFPAVMLVAGSGPNDLDETVGGSKPFRDIAAELAKVGIASLRYDKRQVDYPVKMSANPRLTVDEEQTDDALTAVHLLARQPQIDSHRVFVLGHSQGGMLAPRIGKRDPALAGIIMVAAPARPLLTVMEEQTREQGQRDGLSKERIEASEKALADERALLDKADPKHPPQGEFGGAPQSWWLSLHDYNQVATAKSLSLPMLILQGGSDFQVSPKHDFDAWRAALAGKPDVTFHLYPGLSHLFTPAGKTLTTADYASPAHVDQQVMADIAHWIEAQPPAN